MNNSNVNLHFNDFNLNVEVSYGDDVTSQARSEIEQIIVHSTEGYRLHNGILDLPWSTFQRILPTIAKLQKRLAFKLVADDSIKPLIEVFQRQFKEARKLQNTLVLKVPEEQIDERLESKGFDLEKRRLKPFQKRDLARLLSLSNGANFSVPGAGKTTVTFALHLLTRTPDTHLLVVGPRSSFGAWKNIINECMYEDAAGNAAEPFTILQGGEQLITDELNSGKQRFVISYDQAIRIPHVLTNYLMQNRVHLVLDESHRMKAGYDSLRGSLLLNLASFPIRRDILSGTPMPQSSHDMQSQLDFLWPGVGLGNRISRGEPPKDVLGNLFVRTTKKELGLKRPKRSFIHVPMSNPQLALYSILREKVLAQKSLLSKKNVEGLMHMRTSVVRLLQASVNPTLALTKVIDDIDKEKSSVIVSQLLENPISPKMQAAINIARDNAQKKEKTLIWTIFRDTIDLLEEQLADLNPMVLHGGISSGDENDIETREARIKRFHEDPTCHVIIANPAAVSEGISLHTVCHNAVYVDRNYISTQYLQSIDRIHRLGLDPGTDTFIYILQSKAPKELGSIDYSVSRRLATKIRAMQELLDDADLHEIALDEEEAEIPIDEEIEDVLSLIEELENSKDLTSEEEA